MVIVGCSGAVDIAKDVAKKLDHTYSDLEQNHFPDGELYVKLNKPVKRERVAVVQSFYGDINDKIIEALLACRAAKDNGARSVALVSPYFPYLRQDKVFNEGEPIAQRAIAKIFDTVADQVFIVDPHLHRIRKLSQIFRSYSRTVTAYPLIAEYIEKKLKNVIIIGPDAESYQWAQKAAKKLGVESAIMEKTRYSSRKVSVKLNKEIDLKNKTVVMVDDIISSGHTILEAIKNVKQIGAKKIYVFCIHGLFAEGALSKITRTGAKVITCNTIPNNAAKIDISGLLAKELKKYAKF